MHVVESELERGRLAFLERRLGDLNLHLCDDLFDAGGVNAAVGNQAFDRLLGDRATIRVEA
jgi:hypothetical protein